MNPMRILFYTLAMTFFAVIAGIADPTPDAEADPFSSHSGNKSKLLNGAWFTATGLEVQPTNEGDPCVVPQKEWPDVAAPTTFNAYFDTPTVVWRIDGGFLASFDAGEFGGALFFSHHGSKRWTKILDAHVAHLERFGGDSFLAVGGLAHLGTSEGKAFHLTRGNTGKWKSKLVFKTEVGVPLILGKASTDTTSEAEAEKLIVIALDSPWGRNPLFGISRRGAVHYLGERPKKMESEQGGTGQPASHPESKAVDGDKPQSEAEGRSQ